MWDHCGNAFDFKLGKSEGRCYVIYTGEAVLARVIIHLFVAQAVTSISQSDNAP